MTWTTFLPSTKRPALGSARAAWRTVVLAGSHRDLDLESDLPVHLDDQDRGCPARVPLRATLGQGGPEDRIRVAQALPGAFGGVRRERSQEPRGHVHGFGDLGQRPCEPPAAW